MSRQVSELETLLQQLVDEHQKLLAHVENHQKAMKTFDLKAMDDAVRLQVPPPGGAGAGQRAGRTRDNVGALWIRDNQHWSALTEI